MTNLFKFQSLDKKAIDILVNRRLFLADWEHLNDPHEAMMLVQTPGLNYHTNPKGLNNTGLAVACPDARVCSLSSTWSSNLLWSHYAAGQTGIAIGLELPEQTEGIDIVEVNYDDTVPTLKPPIDRASVLQALGHKSSEWLQENEIRLVSFDESRRFVLDIKITDVILGLRANQEDKLIIERLVQDESVNYWKICHKPGTYKLNRSEL